MGFLPELKVGDCCVAQTGAVTRAAAKMCNLDGSCPEECAKADMIAECCKDLMDGGLHTLKQDPAREAEKNAVFSRSRILSVQF